MRKLTCIIIVLFLIFIQSSFGQNLEKNRVIILTDIEADPDDTQSLVRLLLYANVIDIKGLVATTSCWQKTRIAPESIKQVIQAYSRIQANLNKHEAGFPSGETLLSKVKNGIAAYGMEGVGEGKDTPGSDWIIKTLEEDDERPLWISVWGGSNTLAQALYKIKNTKSAADAKILIAKLRVYAISDQDDSGLWIRKNFPGLFYIVSPGDDYERATWVSIGTFIKGINNELISNHWLEKNIQQGHGPLGVMYPDVAYIMEGDTPAWLSLIPNGLNNPAHPDWGGWGGRYEFYKPEFSTRKRGESGVPFEPEPRAIWTDAMDRYTPYVYNNHGRAVRQDTIELADNKATLSRWRNDFQNDFAARMDWCLKSYQEANHPPVAALAHAETITVKSGGWFTLDASGSSDPDGDHISYLWFNYPEAGSLNERIKISSAENLCVVNVKAPQVKQEETAHFVLKVTDKGTPQLSRYKRVIITIMP